MMPISRRSVLHQLGGAVISGVAGSLASPLLLARSDVTITPDMVAFRPEVEPLVSLIERTPRDRCAEMLVEQFRKGMMKASGRLDGRRQRRGLRGSVLRVWRTWWRPHAPCAERARSRPTGSGLGSLGVGAGCPAAFNQGLRRARPAGIYLDVHWRRRPPISGCPWRDSCRGGPASGALHRPAGLADGR